MPRSIETETSALPFAQLKDKQRRIREGFPEHIGLRIHRALSWLGRAETDTNDPDVRFILLWISFNSAYAADLRDDFSPASEAPSTPISRGLSVSIASTGSTVQSGRVSPRKSGYSSAIGTSLCCFVNPP